MLKSYLKLIFRNLSKYKSYSTINLIGLSTGIATALLMALYVQYETHYDQHLDPTNQVFRVAQMHTTEKNQSRAGMHFPAAPLLAQDNPEIEHATRFHPLLPRLVSYEETGFMEQNFFLGDSSFFKVFDIPVINGSLEGALSRPTDMVITEGTAEKYFGLDWKNQGVVGKTMRVKNTTDYQIVAVVADVPSNSHFTFDLMIPFGKVYGGFILNNWNFNGFYTYVKLKENTSLEPLQSRLRGFVGQYYPEKDREDYFIDLQPIKSIHLNSNLIGELGENSSTQQIYLFAGIGLLILAIASINFTNLMTALGSKRSKEVGMKKVLGAKRINLIYQYLIESTVLTFMASIVAIGMVDLVLSRFNTLVGLNIQMSTIWSIEWVLALVLLTLIVGVLAGLYPALYLTSRGPMKTLQGGASSRNSSATLRKSLVTFQFLITTCLIIAVLTIFQQLNFLREKDLGFNKEAVLVVKSHPKVNQNYNTFRNELMASGVISNVSFSYGNLLGGGSFSVRAQLDQNGADDITIVPLLYTDYTLPQTMGLELKEGRWFSKEFATDSLQAVMINETAAKSFGWEGDALNKQVSYFGGGTTSIEKKARVVGVVKDFFHESFKEELEPLIITLSHTYVPTFPNCYIPIKISGGDWQNAVEQIRTTWDAQNTGVPLEYNFLDDKLEALYTKDQKFGDLINVSAMLALLIASIGVFGLASFTTQMRVKEIGIRKVLGANVTEVLSMMIKSFLKPVFVAFIIAVPISVYLMGSWLQNFAYSVGLRYEIFLITIMASMLIAIAAVFGQSFKAAKSNPVNVLRNE